MIPALSRRALLAATPVALGGVLLEGAPTLATRPAWDEGVPDAYPTQDPEIVREVVGKSHFDLDRVRALVEPRPELARAAWDWGFGDWETALGAASHTGRREIAEYLVEKGARPDLFTFAMLGHVDVVRALVAAQPGIQRLPGPHGITLLAHAQAGGERARETVAFLERLGGADARPVDLPLDEAVRRELLGRYVFGAGERDRFEVDVDRNDQLSLCRAGGVSRALFHRGDREFHPAGAPSVSVRFAPVNGVARELEIHNPELVLRAARS